MKHANHIAGGGTVAEVKPKKVKKAAAKAPPKAKAKPAAKAPAKPRATKPKAAAKE
jgi:hypothetical protein